MVPMTPTMGETQVKMDIQQSRASAVIALDEDITRLKLDAIWARNAGVNIFIMKPHLNNITFDVVTRDTVTRSDTSMPEHPTPNGPEDLAMILFTTGTTGQRKLVPIETCKLIASVALVIKALNLSDRDQCLNMMPLHHVGGLVRNLFAPVIAGGSVVCCKTFDAHLFWQVVDMHEPTWCYATPTMHQLILDESHHCQINQSKIRMICNGGADLRPSLAQRLRSTFNCAILPSYGMTECLPITTPPLDYALERGGTSGRSSGPEIAIFPGEGFAPEKKACSGEIGRICVRGFHVFSGYLVDQQPGQSLDSDAFLEGGWFDTGDIGYLDEDGYLFITGRKKEVINRGGEIVSPVEVEEAITSSAPLRGKVKQTLAFSVPHETLQEVVGIVIVPSREYAHRRPDLRQVREALQPFLPQSKWPELLVYMDSVPMVQGKLQRAGLSKRIQLEVLSNTVTAANRHFEVAKSSCQSTAETCNAINITSCGIDPQGIQQQLETYCGSSEVFVRRNKSDGLLEAIVSGHALKHTENAKSKVTAYLKDRVHGYLVPSQVRFLDGPIPRDETGLVQETLLDRQLEHDELEDQSLVSSQVREIFASALGCSAADLDASTDFFDAGGDSLRAGQVASQLRRKFSIRVAGDILLANSKLDAIIAIVEKSMLSPPARSQSESNDRFPVPGCTAKCSSTNPALLLVQLIPLMVLYPAREAFRWYMFFYTSARAFPILAHQNSHLYRLLHLMLSVAVAHYVTQLVFPLLGIAFKWIIIGKYREGIYPMWGLYHTRWWIVDKMLMIWGKGVFEQSVGLRMFYYRCLGMRIGRNVSIHPKAELGEFDLIEIGDDTTLDACICRPFAVGRNTSMFLGRIRIQQHCFVGLRSVVAPGAELPPGVYLGPNSSSWEMASKTLPAEQTPAQATSPNRPHYLWSLLLVQSVSLTVSLTAHLPWILGMLRAMDHYWSVVPRGGDMSILITLVEHMNRFTDRECMKWYILAEVSHAIIGPLARFAAILLVKRVLNMICGLPIPGVRPQQHSRRLDVRRMIVSKMMPEGNINWLTTLFGLHYQVVSKAMRALGARVGERVYWPFLGPYIQDHELVDVGSDVVFGAMAHFVTTDENGSAPIVIQDGAMVGDRSVLLPGTTVGRRALVGSGCLLRRGQTYPPDTVWLGNRNGDAIQFPSVHSTSEKHDSPGNHATSTPFARAFYYNQANYRVWKEPVIICYTFVVVAGVTAYWSFGSVASILGVTRIIQKDSLQAHSAIGLCGMLTLLIGLVASFQALIGMLISIYATRAILGSRQVGHYHWDKSDYIQRQFLILAIETVLKRCYGGAGVLRMLTSTEYLSAYYRCHGARIGQNCVLYANGNPDLMFTEPDLVTIGDRVAIDNASVVCHINSRGEFELRELHIGSGSVLRTGSRLMSGASMGNEACLLEHTCVLPGDHVDAGVTFQGWPGAPFNAGGD
ncbi:hypothetical protein BJX96DRAFT_173917 [Aspergillus floccosus]